MCRSGSRCSTTAGRSPRGRPPWCAPTPRSSRPTSGRRAEAGMALLEVSGVRARYGAIEALKDVSLTVGEGEVVTLIGSNGAGKSTALRAVCGLTPPAAGTVTFDGEDITGQPADRIVTRGI